MPALRDLDLAGLGVRYLYPHVVAAFPFRDGSSLVFTRDLPETLRSIEALSPGDAAAFQRMWDDFQPMLDQYLIPMTYELPQPALDQMVEFGETPVGRRLAEISELGFVGRSPSTEESRVGHGYPDEPHIGNLPVVGL